MSNNYIKGRKLRELFHFGSDNDKKEKWRLPGRRPFTSSTGAAGSVPGQGVKISGASWPLSQKTKTENRNNTVTNSIKT